MALVYSTQGGRVCPQCRQAQADCRCKALAASAVLGDGKVRVRRETAGRKGKGVTVVLGLPMTAAELTDAAKKLKAACGTGGTVKDGTIEIQGDHLDKVMAWLTQAGFAPKKAGG
ncbi:stress response translation initiation inhibitor YciH [Roseateles aquatilis]|uniref:Stress response translation initiation inhibitor YciH n=1 Tax=Roseateles aquatilis TaxID=431061 RepID=A0A246JFP7_9BURK|nr:translation initiation factor Sui1 [Roseateles aquatilis]OWQ91351.1 stress response translation initiation inhibitor YciH [Roseateles aquatilis]